MASTARIRQRKLGQRSGLLEDFLTERSAPKSDWRSADEGRHRRAAVMGCHDALQPMWWLKVAGAHVGILTTKGWWRVDGAAVGIAAAMPTSAMMVMQ
jgi:hypothetical protein